MQILKIILVSFIGMISVFVAILVFILSTYNNQDYQRLLIKTVDTFSDYTLTINGPFTLQRSMRPAISAADIELHGKSDDSNVRIGNFSIQIALAPLLSRTLLINDLLLENMRVEMQPSGDNADISSLLSYFPVPIIEHALLKDVQLVLGHNKQAQTLDSLVIAAKHKQDPIEIHGSGKVKGRAFVITGQLGPLHEIFAQHQPYPVELLVNWQHAQLSIKGTIETPGRGKGLSLAGKYNIPEIADVFAETIPLQGRLQGSFQIQGDLDEPVLADFQTVMSNEQSMHLTVTGSIGNILTREQTELHLSGFIHNTKLLVWMLPEHSPAFSHLSIEADIHKSSEEFSVRSLNAILTQGEELSIILTGNTLVVSDQLPFRNMQIDAELNANNTATVKQYLGNILPEMGPVKGTAHISTQDQQFMLSKIDLLAGEGQKTQLKATGYVGPLPIDPLSGDSNIVLDLALIAEQSTGITSLLAIKHPEIGPVAIDARLQGSGRELKLEDIRLKAGNPEVLSILANGKMNWEQLDTEHPVQTVDFVVQAQSPSLQNASRLYGEIVPNLGPAEASMRIHGKGVVLQGSKLQMRIGTEQSLLYKVQGKVAHINYADFFYKGLALNGTLIGKSTRGLSELLEKQKIPDFGSVSGKFTIQGDSNALQVPSITLTAGRKNELMLHASGKIAQIPLRQQAAPRGVRIELTAKAPSSKDLSPLAGTEIPDFGPLSITGLLADHNGVLAIDDLLLTAGSPQHPAVRINGAVENVLSRNGLQMKVLFDEQTLVKLFDLKPIPELGGLSGSALISDADGSLGIEEIKLESKQSELIDLKLKGFVDDVVKADEISVDVDLSIKNPKLFGKLFAVNFSGIKPIVASGRLRGNKVKATFKGNNKVGNTRFSSDLVLSFANGKPDISGKISSPNLFLEDFGIIPKAQVTNSPLQRKDTKSVKPPLFSRAPFSLQFLHKTDLNLQLRISKLTGVDYILDKINVDMLLNQGKLKINPAQFVFSGGRVILNAVVDAKDKPLWKLYVRGNNVRIGDVLRQKHEPPPIKGDLDLAVDLIGSGASAHDIAASLNGEVGFALEKGEINRRQLALLFLNPLGWIFSFGINDNVVRISCGLARYQIQQGIVRSSVFLFDGPKLLIKGKEEINLAKETINSLYNLEKKKFFANTSVPIQVTGNLVDPLVKQAPLPSMLSVADRYIFSPVAAIPEELLGTLFGVFDINKNVTSPCNKYVQ